MDIQAPLLVEAIVEMPILNPASKGKSLTFTYMGKVDRVEGGTLIDWKGVTNPGRFITERKIGFQGELYALAEKHAGVDIHTIEYRLVTRPTTLKYKVPKHTWAVYGDSRTKALKTFDNQKEAVVFAGNKNACSSVPNLYRVEHRTTGNPTRDHYEQELVAWLMDDPSRVVQHDYLLVPSKLEQAKWFLWNAAKRVLENRKHKRWLPNTGACFRFNKPCPYIDVCDALQNGADHEWVIKDQLVQLESSHPELDGADKGREVLTHSSISDLLNCDLYYYWRHERRLRQPSDGLQASRIGSAMHVGLEAYSADGQEVAFAGIDKWADANPILGPDAAWRRDEEIARARAMVRVAAAKWHIEPKPEVVPETVSVQPMSTEELNANIPF